MLRDDLIAAARRLLDREGGETAVTIRAVTREAGVAPQSFYLHFSTRDDLLFTLYRQGHEQLYAHLRSAAQAAADADPERRLRDICTAYLAFSHEEPAVYQTLMSTVGEVHDWDPQHLPGAMSFDVIRAAVADVRAPSPSRGAHTAAAAVWAQLHGIAELTRKRPTFPWPPTKALLKCVVATAKA
ncbi:MAG: TetR/AcrR family transcriptional regulator [Mycobacterium sp.]